MQMRFQQKQQQERELRKIEMTGSRSIVESETKSLNSSIGAGKVRQMFDERRQRSTGIDKSYPLKPISGRTTGTTTTASKTTTRKVSTSTTVKQTSTRTSSSETTLITRKANGLNGTAAVVSNKILSTRDSVDNANNNDVGLSPMNAKLPVKMPSLDKLSLDDNKNLNGYYSAGDRNNNKSTSGGSTIKLKPVVTKKSAPEPRTLKKTSSKSSSPSTSRLMSPAPEKASPTRTASKTNSKPTTTASSRMATAAVMQKTSATPAENMAACRICSRHFNVDRIEKHQQICEKTAAKKRKIFDASKHRVKGTEAEQFVKRGVRSTTKSTPVTKIVDPAKKGNWRKKHEEFIQAIRAAKEMKAYLAKGGKLSDLPPPPPSENPDYVQCPHCKRRFNEAAAARHIPKCANMIHNKPKPGTEAKKVPARR